MSSKSRFFKGMDKDVNKVPDFVPYRDADNAFPTHDDRLAYLRGFGKTIKLEPTPTRIRLEKDSEVRYNGKNYRVVDMMGSPKLEEIGKVR